MKNVMPWHKGRYWGGKKKKKASMVEIAAIYTVTNFINKGITFLTTSLFIRFMTKDEYGQFSNIASWTSILIIIATADLYGSITRAKYDFGEEIAEYLSSITLLGNIMTVILYGIVEYNMGFFERIFSIEARYIRFIFLYLMFWPAVQNLQKKSQIYSEYKSVIAISCISLFSTISVSVSLIVLLENKLMARVVGNYFVGSLFGMLLWVYILARGRFIKWKHCIFGLKLCLPLIPHSLAGTLLVSSDRIIINKLCGAEDAALYSLAYTISMIASLFLHSLNQAWIPWMYDRMQEGKGHMINRASIIYIWLFAVFIMEIMLVAPEILLVFGGKEYYEARFVIAPVVMAVQLQFAYTLYVNIEFYCKKVYFISAGTLAATVINIVLNYILIPKEGYIAAAYTTILGYMFMVLFHYLTVAGQCREYVNIYHRRSLILSILLLFCMMVTCLFLYQYILARYVVALLCLLLAGGAIYKNKGDIRQIFGKK